MSVAQGPAIFYVLIDPDELPVMPPIGAGQAWRFGTAKMKELLGR